MEVLIRNLENPIYNGIKQEQRGFDKIYTEYNIILSQNIRNQAIYF